MASSPRTLASRFAAVVAANRGTAITAIRARVVHSVSVRLAARLSRTPEGEHSAGALLDPRIRSCRVIIGPSLSSRASGAG